MKRILSFGTFLLVFSLCVQAQEIKQFGPRAGNYAVGFSADPFLEYLGNMFGKTFQNEAPTLDLSGNYDIFGKYFTSDNMAIRAGFSLDYDSETSFFGAEDENSLKESDISIGLSLGCEKRIGHNRVYGMYGPSIGIGYNTANDAYKYDDDPAMGSILKQNYGKDFSISIGGFAGVEYYICPIFAIGTEIGVGISYYTESKGKIEYEGIDEVETGSKSKGINIGFYNAAAQLASTGSIYFIVVL